MKIRFDNDDGDFLEFNEDGTAIHGFGAVAFKEDIFKVVEKPRKMLACNLDKPDIAKSIHLLRDNTIVISVGCAYSGTTWFFSKPPQEAIDWFNKWVGNY